MAGVHILSLLLRNLSLGLDSLSLTSLDLVPFLSTSLMCTNCSRAVLFISIVLTKDGHSVAASNWTTALLVTPTEASEEQRSSHPPFYMYSGQQHNITYGEEGKPYLPTSIPQSFNINFQTRVASLVFLKIYIDC